MLLSRVADRIYWGARYIERAEDIARIVRAFTDLVADLPAEIDVSWEPLVAIAGSNASYRERAASGDEHAKVDVERAVVSHLVADGDNIGSVRACIAGSRENLRTTREILPREAWEALNYLYLHVERDADISVSRTLRRRFLTRVLSDSRRIDGILATSMTHDDAYVMWRLGRAIERADMTTRVLGVRAADILEAQRKAAEAEREAAAGRTGDGAVVSGSDAASRSSGSSAGGQLQSQWQGHMQSQFVSQTMHGGDPRHHEGIQWMGVLRSLTAHQMYQRAVRGAIEGPAVVEFLLFHERFPRAVRCCLRELSLALRELPDPSAPLGALDRVVSTLELARSASGDGAMLDDAMDRIQVALDDLDEQITERYLRVPTK